MNKNTLLTILVVLITISAISLFVRGIRPARDNEKSDKLSVVASFYPMYYFSEQIGGEHASIKNITPAGSEPHDYDLSTRDIAAIEDSSLLIINGGVEPWVENIRDNVAALTIINSGEGLFTNSIDDEDGQKVQDPHIWLSPIRAKTQAQRIYEGFVKVDPENTDEYKKNLDSLIAKLEATDASFKEGLSQCNKKSFVTSHAAFSYLASDYGLNQVPIAGLSADEEPSAQQMVEVAKYVRDNAIEVIFFETLISPKLSETIANEVGAKTLVLDPLEGLLESDMQSGKDYFSVMNNNLINLKTALQCK